MIKLKDFPEFTETFLRQKSTPIETYKEAVSIKDQLEELFPKHGAYAVSAPQIGILKSVFLIHPKFNHNEFLCVCNPVIKKKSSIINFREGCLSFPKKFKNTIRYNEIVVEFKEPINGKLETKKVLLEGIEAIIFQHEIDHFNGVLFKDRVLKPLRRTPKIGRNEPCPCKSSKKYKKCCLNKDK